MEIVGLPNCRKKGVYSAEVLDSDSVVVFHGCPCVAFRRAIGARHQNG